jgi:hypothetical protein
MNTKHQLRELLSLSENPERLLAEIIIETLSKDTAVSEEESPQTVESEGPEKAVQANEAGSYQWADTFYVGAKFTKRKSIRGHAPVTLTVAKVQGINVWFDVDFRCKAWRNSSKKRAMNSRAARLFLEEFARS